MYDDYYDHYIEVNDYYADLDEDDREADWYEHEWSGPDDEYFEGLYDEYEYESYYEDSYDPEDFEPLAPPPSAHRTVRQGVSVQRSMGIRDILTIHIKRRVYLDPRSTKDEDGKLICPLGYPKDFICERVIGRGLVDFNKGFYDPKYGKLSPGDKVLLYCYFNMKGRFETALEVFGRHRPQLESLFSSDGQTRILDVGCGPGTACLALADLLRGRTFRYIGIDSAAPMRDQALQLWRAATKEGVISDGSTASLARTWDKISLDKLQTDVKVFLVFSYFFASHSLNDGVIQSLARFVRALQDSPRITSIVMAYTNSSNPVAKSKYGLFKSIMKLDSRAVELNPGREYELIQLK